jgi:hypothetical protein
MTTDAEKRASIEQLFECRLDYFAIKEPGGGWMVRPKGDDDRSTAHLVVDRNGRIDSVCLVTEMSNAFARTYYPREIIHHFVICDDKENDEDG